jgi:hypothetical protein
MSNFQSVIILFSKLDWQFPNKFSNYSATIIYLIIYNIFKFINKETLNNINVK